MLYPDCKQGQKKLGTTLELLQWKASNGLSDKGFEELLKLIKNLLPEGNTLPETTYEAKKLNFERRVWKKFAKNNKGRGQWRHELNVKMNYPVC